MPYAGVAALRVALATPKCNFSSSGAASAAWARPCDMRPGSKTRQSSGLFACLTVLEMGGGGGSSPT